MRKIKISAWLGCILVLTSLMAACSSPSATVPPAAAATATKLAPTAVSAASTAASEAGTAAATETTCTTAGVNATTLVTAGDNLYATRCAACHGNTGGGGQGPALVNNTDVSNGDYAAVLTKFLNPKTHPFAAQMSTQDIASVLSYVRSTFGQAAAICPEQINRNH